MYVPTAAEFLQMGHLAAGRSDFQHDDPATTARKLARCVLAAWMGFHPPKQDTRLRDIENELRELPRLGLGDAEEDAARAALRAERDTYSLS
jgi:cytochrome P450